MSRTAEFNKSDRLDNVLHCRTLEPSLLESIELS